MSVAQRSVPTNVGHGQACRCCRCLHCRLTRSPHPLVPVPQLYATCTPGTALAVTVPADAFVRKSMGITNIIFASGSVPQAVVVLVAKCSGDRVGMSSAPSVRPTHGNYTTDVDAVPLNTGRCYRSVLQHFHALAFGAKQAPASGASSDSDSSWTEYVARLVVCSVQCTSRPRCLLSVSQRRHVRLGRSTLARGDAESCRRCSRQWRTAPTPLQTARKFSCH